MFRKYEKTFRITTPNYQVKGKLNLTRAEQNGLLTGMVQITEKVDGANVGIVKGKKDKWVLQKRRGLADEGVHAQFSFFWNWARHNIDKILNIPSGWIIYGELCFAKHHVSYDMLPSYFLVFDIWDGRRYIKDSDGVVDYLGFQHVPILHVGYIDDVIELERFITTSNLATESVMEGIVVKNYRKQTRGKLVRPEFMKEIEDEGHWMHKSYSKNVLAPNANVYD
jgi:ATP-dependent RNA circularization protein (DNA/RNA ligase family)